MKYTFERVAQRHYKDLVFLFQQSFGEKVDTAYYESKFDTAYTGHTHLGYVAYAENETIAAFYGVFPYPINHSGKIIIAGQSGDTMTHPQHTGKGLFVTLAKLTYDLCKSEGIAFIFGFPNQNSYPGFVRKLNWTHKENIQQYEMKVITAPLAGFAQKFPFLRPAYEWYVRKVIALFFEENKGFPNHSCGNERLFVEHSDSFFEYKKFYGSKVLKINGIRMWINIKGALLVGDIEFSDHKTDEILKTLKRIAVYLGCTKVIFMTSPETRLDVLLQTRFTPKKGLPIGYLDLSSGIDISDLKFCYADFDTF